MKRIKIPLNKLFSPKSSLDYKKLGKEGFFQLIQEFRANMKCEPITVCPDLHDMYYIQNGVHRAKAAQLAGKTEIEAMVFEDSRPTGPKILLEKVQL